MIRVAVIGVGYLGRFHAQKYAQMEGVELVGVVDISSERAEDVARETGTAHFTDYRDLIGKIDAASIVVPTIYHFDIALDLLKSGVHCMVEKPIATTVSEAEDLIEAAENSGVVLQVGHLERFNPAVEFLVERVTQPLFIEGHRLSVFKDRATDVDVVLDLMIHDIDIVLALVDSPLKEIRAVGLPVLTPKVDIANARLIFENGCTANLTASRISLQNMRRVRVFQQGAYISADCTERKNLIVTTSGIGQDKTPLVPELKSHGNVDILYSELESFIQAVRGEEEPRVSGNAGKEALKLALEINTQIHNGLVSSPLIQFP